MVKRMEPPKHDRAVGPDGMEQVYAPSSSSKPQEDWMKDCEQWPQP